MLNHLIPTIRWCFYAEYQLSLFVMSLPSKHPIPFDRPATYRIRVQGRIAPAMSDILGGMMISQATVEASPPVTTLEGELRDQTALAGVLNSLYELHLPVLSVMCLES
jgi:hypothetical protein